MPTGVKKTKTAYKSKSNKAAVSSVKDYYESYMKSQAPKSALSPTRASRTTGSRTIS